MKAVVAFLVLLGVPLWPAWGGSFQTGNDLLSECSAVKEEATYYQRNAGCRAYVVGVTDMLEVMNEVRQTSNPSSPRSFCLPGGVTQGQVTDIAIQYLTKNANQRHFPAAALVWNAMVEAFPCR